MKSYIFIDGSYFIYHRYFSLIRWWKLSNPESYLDDNQTYFSQNTIFVDKFKKIFLESIHSLPKKFNQLGSTIIVGKDCKKENIWRKQYYQEYKANRQHNEDISFFMTLAYNELFIQPHISTILYHPSLEADDCIAIYIKDILSSQSNTIHIITSDRDYLQLMSTNIHIFDSKFTDLTKQKSSFGSAEKNLFCKIIMGDTSDNIPSVFTKCGAITASKLYDNPISFQEKLSREKANDKWKLNQLLVDFNYIPTQYREEFNMIYKRTENT